MTRRRKDTSPGMPPAYPVVLTKHSIQRFRKRHAPHLSVDEASLALAALAKVAVWAGKTWRGTAMLTSGNVLMVVKRHEYKYRVVTVLPPDAHELEEAAAATA